MLHTISLNSTPEWAIIVKWADRVHDSINNVYIPQMRENSLHIQYSLGRAAENAVVTFVFVAKSLCVNKINYIFQSSHSEPSNQTLPPKIKTNLWQNSEKNENSLIPLKLHTPALSTKFDLWANINRELRAREKPLPWRNLASKTQFQIQ